MLFLPQEAPVRRHQSNSQSWFRRRLQGLRTDWGITSWPADIGTREMRAAYRAGRRRCILGQQGEGYSPYTSPELTKAFVAGWEAEHTEALTL